MLIVVLAGPPCGGKTTLAHRVAQDGDVVLTHTEHGTLHAIDQAYLTPGDSTAWVLSADTPRPEHRARLAQRWGAEVYLLNPGEQVCRRRAAEAGRPSGTRQAIGLWYHRHSAWVHDLNPSMLDESFVNVSEACRGLVEVDPRTV